MYYIRRLSDVSRDCLIENYHHLVQTAQLIPKCRFILPQAKMLPSVPSGNTAIYSEWYYSVQINELLICIYPAQNTNASCFHIPYAVWSSLIISNTLYHVDEATGTWRWQLSETNLIILWNYRRDGLHPLLTCQWSYHLGHHWLFTGPTWCGWSCLSWYWSTAVGTLPLLCTGTRQSTGRQLFYCTSG